MKSDCVFCTRALFEERLISENGRFYVIATLGQITDGGYVLIVPKRHVSCLGEMEVNELEEVERLKDFTTSALAEEGYGKSVSLFEHGKVGQTIQHAHLHLVPALLKGLDDRLSSDFPDKKIRPSGDLGDIYWKYQIISKPYLLWKIGDEQYHSCWNPSAPKQYFRIIVSELLGCPERSDWKKVDPELDRSFWAGTVNRLSPYFSHPMVRAYEEFLNRLRNSQCQWQITKEGYLRTMDNFSYCPIRAVYALIKENHCYPGGEMIYAKEIGLPEELAIVIIKASDNEWMHERAIQEVRQDLLSAAGL